MNDDSLCELCSSRPAKMVVVRRRHEDIDRTFVCCECASERARLYAGTDFDLTSVLARADPNAAMHVPAYSCRFCGTTLADIIADGKPGCCSCYGRFAGEIEQAIQTTQGCTHHTGKASFR
jgi:protein-arginine kinase activator protein McsA